MKTYPIRFINLRKTINSSGSLLSELFPKIQFIASTHSVIPFLGTPKKSVFLKATKTQEEDIKITRVEIDIQNLLPNAILTSPLFDFEQLMSLNHNRSYSTLKFIILVIILKIQKNTRYQLK